jgi:hypothetical protein
LKYTVSEFGALITERSSVIPGVIIYTFPVTPRALWRP